jgi:hypothetical protein
MPVAVHRWPFSFGQEIASIMTLQNNDKIKRIAGFLLIPGVMISVAAIFLLPWMLQTKRRLDNSYWEEQLTFAMVCLSFAAAGLPFLVLRFLNSAVGSSDRNLGCCLYRVRSRLRIHGSGFTAASVDAKTLHWCGVGWT